MAQRWSIASSEIQSHSEEGAHTAAPNVPRWPMIVLRSPKGWTGPKEVDGHKVEGSWRAHQVPILDVRENPEHLKQRRRMDAEL